MKQVLKQVFLNQFTAYAKCNKMMSKRKKAVKVVKRKRISYFVEQKIQIVTYAKEQENSKAAKHFNINISMVGRWVIASSK